MLFARPSLAYSAFEGRSPPPFTVQLLSQKLGIPSTNEIDASHHMAAIMELDLTACHPNSLVDKLNAMPALKTSAAFFTFLRANLAICPTEMSSNVSTPVLGPIAHAPVRGKLDVSAGTTSTRSATASAAAAAASLDDIPPLSLDVLTTRADKVDALRLVADSIAQQRQTASRSLVFHPLNLAGLAVVFAVAYQINPNHDLGTTLTMISGIAMTYLLGIRYWSAQYIHLAESLRWEWLESPVDDAAGAAPVEPVQDTVIGARYGNEMIGALVLRLAGGDGVVRAWTTKLRYRRRGIGSDLLAKAVEVTRSRLGSDAGLRFAADHANNKRVLPELYNAPFRAAEQQAAQTLGKMLAQLDGQRKR